MANTQVKDATGATVYHKADGAGTDIDPRVPHVVIDSSGIPTGAATEATLATRLSESDFDGKTGALTETAPATDTASSGLNGRLQRIAQRITSLIALLPAALDGSGFFKTHEQGTAAISAASLPLPSGASTAAKQPALGTAGTPSADVITVQGVTSMTALKVDGSAVTQPVSAASLPLPTGAATEATLATRLTESDFDTKVGALTETAPATDTASSGLNGRLQRIAQRITSLIALLPSALSNGFFQVSVKETIALPVTDNSGSLTVDGTVTANLAAGTNNIGDVDVLSLPALPAGTNNIGDVDVLSIAAGDNNIGNVDVASLPATPAGTNLIGSVNVQLDASTMRDGAGTALTPKFAIIDAASSGDNTLLAAVSSKKIRVLAAFLVSSGTVNVRFESGAGGTALSGQMNLIANTGFVLPFNPVGWFETAATTLLNLELSAAISVDGSLVYVEV